MTSIPTRVHELPELPAVSQNDAPRFPVKAFLAVIFLGHTWHLVLLAFGSSFFDPPKTVDKPRSPQEIAAKIIVNEAWAPAQPFYHWDALWFVHLSRFGYVLETNHDGEIEQSNLAFTPGLAFVAGEASEWLVADEWDFLISFNAGATLAAMAGLAVLTWNLTHSRPAMIWSVVMFNAWPWRFFMAMPYQEAAGAALTFWACYAACRGSLIPGFVCTILASMFRLNAVGLFGGMIVGCGLEFLRNRERPLQVRCAFIALGALVGWATLLVFFHSKFGDASLGLKIQSAWGRQPPHLTGIFESLAGPLLHPMTGTEWLDWAAAWTVLSAIPFVYRNHGMVWASSLAGLTFQALSTGRVLSFGRFALLACPFFVVAGTVAAKRPVLAKVVCILNIAAQIGLAWRYGHNLFAG